MIPAPEKFISEEITVVRDEKRGQPISFRWRGRRYEISQIIAIWPDWGFPAGAPRRKNWRMRRHRNCYRVETTDGSVFELYHDRGVKSEYGIWILRTQLA